jgi:putative DNA primase/helicase
MMEAFGTPQMEQEPKTIKLPEGCEDAVPAWESGYRYEPNDTGNAERLVRMFGDRIRFIHETGEWMVWSEKGWVKDTNGKLMRMSKEIVKEVALEACADPTLFKHAAHTASRGGRKAMIELAGSEQTISTNFGDWDADKWLLNVLNGVIDLRSQTFRERKPTDLCMRQANVNYDPEALCQLWDAALLKYMCGDQSMVTFLQGWIGYSLTGTTSAQALIFNKGDGNNGKDTFTSTVSYMLGSYAANASFSTFVETKHHSEHRNDLAVLAGAIRFLTSAETTDGHSLDEDIIKVVTGQSPVTVRHIYARPFTYLPEYKLCFSSNYEPVIKGQDFAIWRRVKRVPWDYTVTPEELIEDFSDKLKQEAPGILNWALRGLAAYIEMGKMAYPQKILDATNQYREEMDIIGRFVKERCTLRPDATAVGSEMYRSYASWCQENGFYATNSRKFYAEFRKRYVGQREGQQTGRVGETDCSQGTLFHGIGVLVDGRFPVMADVEEKPHV